MLTMGGLQYFAALVFVLGLILGLAWLLRRVPPELLLGRQLGTGRLAVTASLRLDPQRRLVLVRCDDQEHLLLLAPHQPPLLHSGRRAERAPLDQAAAADRQRTG